MLYRVEAMLPYFNTLSETIKKIQKYILLKFKIRRPLVLLVNAHWKQGKCLGSATIKMTKADIFVVVW
jgi:hypothetical protein